MRRRRNVDYFLKNHLSEANKKQNATKIGTNDHLIRSKIWLSGNWQHNSYKCVFWTRNTFLTSKNSQAQNLLFFILLVNTKCFAEGGKWEKFKFPSLVVAVVFHSANASKIDFFFYFHRIFLITIYIRKFHLIFHLYLLRLRFAMYNLHTCSRGGPRKTYRKEKWDSSKEKFAIYVRRCGWITNSSYFVSLPSYVSNEEEKSLRKSGRWDEIDMMKVVFIFYYSQWGKMLIFRFFISCLPDWMLKFIKENRRKIIYWPIELTFWEIYGNNS